jgi:Tfp pilus assembly protein PilF
MDKDYRHGTIPASVAPLVIIALFAIVIYAPSLKNCFCYDDNVQIIGNQWVTSFTYLKDVFTQNVDAFDRRLALNHYYRPLMYVTYMIDYAIFGLQPWSYRLINIFLHAASSALLFLIMARLLPLSDRGPWGSPFIAALIFAGHPIHTEDVMWISALPDVACSFLCLAAFYLHIRSKDSPHFINKNNIVSALLFFGALLYKEIAITLPLIIIINDLCDNNNKRLSLKRNIIYVVPTVAYIVLRLNAFQSLAPSSHFGDPAFREVIYTAVVLLPHYIAKTLFPVDLTIFHGFQSVTTFDSTVLISAIAAAAFLSLFFIFRRRKIIIISLAIFLFPLLPALYLPALGETPFAERYLYLPSVGFAILTGMFLNALRHHKLRQFSYATTVIILMLYSIGVIQQTHVWENNLTLWRSAVSHTPHSSPCHRNLASVLLQQGKIKDAIGEYRVALSLNPKDSFSHLYLADAYLGNGQTDQAIQEYSTALFLKPNLFGADVNLCAAYANKGQFEQALKSCDAALRLIPDSSDAHEDKGLVLESLGRIVESIRELEKAVALCPQNYTFKDNLQKARQRASWPIIKPRAPSSLAS